MLRHVTLAQRTEFVVQKQDVVRLRQQWRRRRCCEWTAVNDELVIVCGGVVVRLDAAGQVLWIRRPWNLPPDEDPHWLTQSYQPPLVLEDLVFAGSPGCRLLEAIDWRFGTVRWSRQIMDLERIVGVSGPLLVLQTTKGLLACRLADGEVAWRTELEQLTTGVAVGPNFVVALQRYPIDAAKTRYRPRLLWVDLGKGVPRASTPLADLA